MKLLSVGGSHVRPQTICFKRTQLKNSMTHSSSMVSQNEPRATKRLKFKRSFHPIIHPFSMVVITHQVVMKKIERRMEYWKKEPTEKGEIITEKAWLSGGLSFYRIKQKSPDIILAIRRTIHKSIRSILRSDLSDGLNIYCQERDNITGKAPSPGL